MHKTTPNYSRPDNNELKKKLTQQQYQVLCNNGTEPAFSSEYWTSDEDGIYVNIATGEPLFTSHDKFPSKCGWPSFAKPIDDASITQKKDVSHAMLRTEVRGSDLHLGHVFTDGPKELGGLRYCINGAAIRFIPMKDILIFCPI